MIMCIRRWHTDVSKIAQTWQNCTPTNTQLTVSSFAYCVRSPTHQCVCHNTHTRLRTHRWPRQYLTVLSWFVMAPLLDLIHRTVLDCFWVFSWLDQLYLPSHDLSYGEEDDFSANATRAGQAAVSKEDTWDTTLSCDLLAGFGMIKLERSQLSTPHPHSLLWSTNLMQIIWEHSCFFGGGGIHTNTYTTGKDDFCQWNTAPFYRISYWSLLPSSQSSFSCSPALFPSNPLFYCWTIILVQTAKCIILYFIEKKDL